MAVPRIGNFCCCSLKFGNIFWCWIEFFGNLFCLLVTCYVFFIYNVKDQHFIAGLDEYIASFKYSTGFFVIGLQTFIAVICLYFIFGIKNNKPHYLLPFAFKNSVTTVVFLLHGLCFLYPTFLIGLAFAYISIANFSLYDELLDESIANNQQSQMEMTSHPKVPNQYFMEVLPRNSSSNCPGQWVSCACDMVANRQAFCERPRCAFAYNK